MACSVEEIQLAADKSSGWCRRKPQAESNQILNLFTQLRLCGVFASCDLRLRLQRQCFPQTDSVAAAAAAVSSPCVYLLTPSAVCLFNVARTHHPLFCFHSSSTWMLLVNDAAYWNDRSQRGTESAPVFTVAWPWNVLVKYPPCPRCVIPDKTSLCSLQNAKLPDIFILLTNFHKTYKTVLNNIYKH